MTSAGPSTPLGEVPSITPNTPLPWALFAMITSTGLAVAQKMEHTSGTFCSLGHGVDYGFIHVLGSFNEVSLANDDIGVGGNFHSHRFEIEHDDSPGRSS
jgi:hypothetical protein